MNLKEKYRKYRTDPEELFLSLILLELEYNPKQCFQGFIPLKRRDNHIFVF